MKMNKRAITHRGIGGGQGEGRLTCCTWETEDVAAGRGADGLLNVYGGGAGHQPLAAASAAVAGNANFGMSLIGSVKAVGRSGTSV